MLCTGDCRSFLSSPTTCWRGEATLRLLPGPRSVPTSIALLLNTRDPLFTLAYPRASPAAGPLHPPSLGPGSGHPQAVVYHSRNCEFSLSLLRASLVAPAGPTSFLAPRNPRSHFSTSRQQRCASSSTSPLTGPISIKPILFADTGSAGLQSFLGSRVPVFPCRAPFTIRSSGPRSPATPLAAGPLLPQLRTPRSVSKARARFSCWGNFDSLRLDSKRRRTTRSQPPKEPGVRNLDLGVVMLRRQGRYWVSLQSTFPHPAGHSFRWLRPMEYACDPWWEGASLLHF